MKYSELEYWSARAGKWATRYHATLRDRPVRAQCSPGEFAAQIPGQAPESAESMETIFADFERLVPDSMTHWQHPRFLAYFPANAAPASILADQLVNSIACNCLLWQASPAASELEGRMIDWLRIALGLPDGFSGLIHDSATTATVCAVMTMRERATAWSSNKEGLHGQGVLRVYASAENHSSIEKAVRLAGIGSDNLVSIPTDESLAMEPDELRLAITRDLEEGRVPAGLIVCVGGTANGACDRVGEVIEVAKSFGLYCHADAAWAGSAMICPELRDLWDGVEQADSIVFNPHKWLGAQFDCSVQFLADMGPQHRTLGLRPEYLQTEGGFEITEYNELTIPLGRRFRALKLWFLLRAYGLEGLRTLIRNHIAWIKKVEEKFRSDPDFEVVSSTSLALFTFRLNLGRGDSDELTRRLCNSINDDGRIFLTRASCDGKTVIRVSAGTFECTEEDVMQAYTVTRELADRLELSETGQ